MSAAGIEIVPVVYGASVLPESMIFAGGRQDRVRPISFRMFLLLAGERRILADAGCETMPGFEMTDFIGPVRALAKLGFSPEEITDVIVTHAHHDHIECVGRYKNAVIHIQEDEFLAGKGHFTPDMTVRIFAEEAEIAEGIRAVKIGGHSKGSCVVEVTTQGRCYVIAGDECYLRECLLRNIPTGCSYDPEKSRAFLQKYGTEQYTVLLCHEP